MNPVQVNDPVDLTQADYDRIRRLVYAQSGINLGDKKMQLVRARLGKIIRARGFESFRAYYELVEEDSSGEELRALLDAITTNTTHLFREIRHFNLLRKQLETWLADRAWRANHSTVRIWSAACSSGEEPHSIAMVALDVLQHHPGAELKILATDLSRRALQRATAGVYETHRVGTIPPELKQQFLRPVSLDGRTVLQLVPHLRQCITFARFNLMTPTFPFKNKFDVIFCRNVMIYFDRPTQQTLVAKLADHLHPGGYLLIGHAESLNAVEHKLAYIEPTVYRK